MQVSSSIRVRIGSVAVIVAAVCSPGNSATSFSDAGSMEFGGQIGFSNTSGPGATVNTFSVAPVLNFFPAQHFLLGPAIGYTGEWGGGNSLSEFNLGINTGIVAPINDGSAFFYLTSGVQLVLAGESESGFGSSNATGYAIPINVGVKIPVQKHIAINLGPSLTFTTVSGQTTLQVLISCAITGLVF